GDTRSADQSLGGCAWWLRRPARGSRWCRVCATGWWLPGLCPGRRHASAGDRGRDQGGGATDRRGDRRHRPCRGYEPLLSAGEESLLDRGDVPPPHAGSEARSLDPTEGQQSDDARAMSAVGLEQLEHAGLAAPRLAGKCPRHLVRQMVVAHGHDITIAQGDDGHLGRRPWTDAL